MIANFNQALTWVLADEGGNDDDPEDHGGRTSRGITQREYTVWKSEQGEPSGDVWNATQQDVTAIYHDEYWEPYCDLLPNGIDYLYFDMAVNAGPHRATVLLQRALDVPDDGRIGPVTRNAIRSADPKQLIADYSDEKRDFYLSLHQPKFIRGWLNRIIDVRANALTLV